MSTVKIYKRDIRSPLVGADEATSIELDVMFFELRTVFRDITPSNTIWPIKILVLDHQVLLLCSCTSLSHVGQVLDGASMCEFPVS